MSTFKYFKDVLAEDVNRSDKEHRYADWIRQGIRKVQQDVSWNCMRRSGDTVISAGSLQAALPADFKEFTPEATPVHIKSNNTFFPVLVTTFEAMAAANAGRERLIIHPGSGRSDSVPVYLSYETPMAQPFLNMFDNASETLTFRVSYFGFLPDLQADEDENYLTVNYTEMVEAKIKSVAFKAINDPVAAEFEAEYQRLKIEAEGDDARRRYQGRTLKMGG
jgi:hypothetical protein